MARFDPLRTIAIDVVFRPLDRPDHIGLLQASGFKAHFLCHFLDLVEIHMAPPKSLVKGDGVVSCGSGNIIRHPFPMLVSSATFLTPEDSDDLFLVGRNAQNP